ncbi:MAG: substrate-binding domain-containing protein, partial [Desulfomonilaceae bacterium]
MKTHELFLGLVLIIVSTANALAQTQDQESVIRVSGSDSMFYRVKLMGQLFAKINPSFRIDTSQGGTMDSGIRAVINGEADLAMAASSINEEEDKLAASKGVKLVERLIGYGGIVIIA